MAINLHCPKCKSGSSLKSRSCKKCGHDLSKAKKYRVVVKSNNGKRVSKIMDSISMAKKFERKIKTQVVEKTIFGLSRILTVDEIWEHYLSWAKQYKKSWNKDLQRWQLHVQPYLNDKKMDTVAAFDVQKAIENMKAKRDYAPATIRHVVVLIKRVYNWAMEMDLYQGENPASKIKLPKLNNEVTECLSKQEIKRLLKTLDNWQNKMVSLLIQFALYTGLRRGELFSLQWDEVDLENGWVLLLDTKGGKDNKLPISDRAMEILVQTMDLGLSHACPYVFPNRFGDKRTTFGNTWTRIKKCAKIPHGFRFHGLRHMYASYLAS